MNEKPWVFAYEMDYGPDGRTWEVYDDGMGYLLSVHDYDFGDWLTHARTLGFDVLINTFESWLAYECMAAE